MAACGKCIHKNVCVFCKEMGFENVVRANDFICKDFIPESEVVKVRCEKCMYCAKTKEYDFCTNKHNFIDRKALRVYAKHFCSYGERKDR